MQKALELEEKARFINLDGHSQTFALFMLASFKALFSEYDLHGAVKLKEKYKLYANLDVFARFEVVKESRKFLQILLEETSQPEELIEESKEIIKPEQAVKEIKFRKETIWETEIKWAAGVGPLLAKTLNKLNIFTVQDLLFYWPREHLDFSKKLYINQVKAGEDVTVVGTVSKVNVFASPRNANLLIFGVHITDSTGTISLNKFIAGRSGKFLAEQYKKQFPLNALIMASGRVQFDKQTRYQLTNFSTQILEESNEGIGQLPEQNNIELACMIPIYGLTEGLSQTRLRRIIKKAIETFKPIIQETLTDDLKQKYNLNNLIESIQEMHFPSSREGLERAKNRIVFEEFFFLQLPLAFKRYEKSQNLNLINQAKRAVNLSTEGFFNQLLTTLPFKLTNAQERVVNEIMADLTKPIPMNRLVQGDVGSGKTVVALLCMLLAIEKGQQAALMAPTEILAEQHFHKFQELILPLGLRVGLLIGSQKTAERRDILTGLSNGQIQLVVGTHALIQTGVDFHNLGIVIIDEQHRFGVKQRDLLRKKGNSAEFDFIDCLHMTATPIPRTLALTMYGNLDLSEIDELPPGRKPIKTKIIPSSQRRASHEFVKKQLSVGRQAYIVYPLIEESESISAKAITEEAIKLAKTYTDYQIGIVHGKLSAQEKEKVMKDFRNNEIQVLIGTTVIEVGVDVPNATIMIIENAERFGLAQLHQLRGRVGRGGEQSYCFLFSESKSATSLERLKIMELTENGFIIAQKDLELRGPGELIGTRQSGLSDFALNSLVHQADILEQALGAARLFAQEYKLEDLPMAGQQKIKYLKTLSDLLESG